MNKPERQNRPSIIIDKGTFLYRWIKHANYIGGGCRFRSANELVALVIKQSIRTLSDLEKVRTFALFPCWGELCYLVITASSLVGGGAFCANMHVAFVQKSPPLEQERGGRLVGFFGGALNHYTAEKLDAVSSVSQAVSNIDESTAQKLRFFGGKAIGLSVSIVSVELVVEPRRAFVKIL